MTEMTDLSGELEGSGIPFLDYNTYAQRVFFPGQGGALLQRGLDLPEGRRATVEQGLGQFSNLLNSKVFLLTVSTLEKVGGGGGGGFWTGAGQKVDSMPTVCARMSCKQRFLELQIWEQFVCWGGGEGHCNLEAS